MTLVQFRDIPNDFCGFNNPEQHSSKLFLSEIRGGALKKETDPNTADYLKISSYLTGNTTSP
jgi:hypothetical protein